MRGKYVKPKIQKENNQKSKSTFNGQDKSIDAAVDLFKKSSKTGFSFAYESSARGLGMSKTVANYSIKLEMV